MVYRSNHASSGSESTRSNRKRYYRLSLPYPSDHNDSVSLEKGGYRRENEEAKSTPLLVFFWKILRTKYFAADSTFLDPYLAVNKLEDSLIAKDSLFLHPSVPKPILVKKTPKKLSGLGLGIQMEQQSPVSGLFEGIPSPRMVQSPSLTSLI